MKKYYFSILFFLFISFSISAQKTNNSKAAENWIDAAVNEKLKIQASLKKANLPIKSSWIKGKEQAEKISADITGQQKLVLMTSGGPDGYSWDWAVWANAKLIKADGSSVWLDEIKPELTRTSNFALNKNIRGNKLSIGSKEYYLLILRENM